MTTVEEQLEKFLVSTPLAVTPEVGNLMLGAISRIAELKARRDVLLESNNHYLQRARDAEEEVRVMLQAITDPENQPSQWGTVLAPVYDLALHRARVAEIMFPEATLQNSYGSLRDYDAMVVYRDPKDGKIWVRGKSEFWDGRFVEVGHGEDEG